MKFHWGIRMGVVFVVFAIGILVMVRISMNHDIDLVSDDYYQQELRHQEQIDTEKRSRDLPEQPTVSISPTSVIVRLPRTFSAFNTSGILTFYRPADRQKDFNVALRLDSASTQIVPVASLQKGLWRLKVRWSRHDETYYHEEAIVIQ
jgi:hypothetical protein